MARRELLLPLCDKVETQLRLQHHAAQVKKWSS